MNDTYHLQRAEDQGDIEGICDLENVLFDNSFGQGTIMRELSASYVVVARTDRLDVGYGVAGYAILRPGPGIGDLLRLGVHPLMQGKGIGAALLDHVLVRFGRPMMLTVQKNNSPAFGLYRRRGFEIVAVNDDAWVMRR